MILGRGERGLGRWRSRRGLFRSRGYGRLIGIIGFKKLLFRGNKKLKIRG